MVSVFRELVIDCHDPEAMAEFWRQALGCTDIQRENDGPSATVSIRGGGTPLWLVFMPVPEAKAGKNRLHIDLSPERSEQADEIERLLALGASWADVGQPKDAPWTVLADPEGNEFCVLRSSIGSDGDEHMRAQPATPHATGLEAIEEDIERGGGEAPLAEPVTDRAHAI